MSNALDVIEVEIASRRIRSIVACNNTAKNAEAIVEMAVIRRGYVDCFFTTYEHGAYIVGEIYD